MINAIFTSLRNGAPEPRSEVWAQASARVSGAPAQGSRLTPCPRPAARHPIAPLVYVFLPLAGPTLLMRAACVLGSARSSPKPESSLSEAGIITCAMVVHCEQPQLRCVWIRISKHAEDILMLFYGLDDITKQKQNIIQLVRPLSALNMVVRDMIMPEKQL